MSPRARKWLTWLGYFAFYLVSFIFFVYLTFPFGKLRNYIVNSFNEGQRSAPNPTYLQIDELTSYWGTGVEAEGVRLISPSSVQPDGKTKPASTIEIDHATARVSILPLLLGHVTVNFTLDAFEGVIEGSFSKSGEDKELTIEFDDVEVGKVKPIVDMVGLPMRGTLSGQVHWLLPNGKLSKAKGDVDLSVASLSIGDGKAKLRDAVALPKMRVGNLKLKAKVANGHMNISKFGSKGKDLILTSTGKIDFRDILAQSKVDIFIQFKFTDKYRGKNEKTKAIFGAPGSKAPALFEMADPKIRRSKRSDGFYSWRIWGLLKNLRYDPAPLGPGKGRSRPRSKKSHTNSPWLKH